MFLLCKLIEDNLDFLVETCGFLVALSFFPGGTMASSWLSIAYQVMKCLFSLTLD